MAEARTIARPLTGRERAGSSPLSLFADRWFRWLILAPSILVILLVGVYPLVYSLITSFQRINQRVTDTSFQGLRNYARLVGDERFWDSVLNTAIFTGVALPIELILGLLIARLFLEPIRGRQLLVALLILPSVIAPFVGGAMWRLMFDNIYGPINQILSWLSGAPVEIIWLVNSSPLIVFGAILICEIWQWTPFMFLILLAGMSSIDRSLIEAAELDGAGPLQVFVRIIIPLLRPVILVALTIRGLDLVRLFDIVYALTRGGPGSMTETISIYAYVTGFERFDVSYTAAIAFVVILLLTIVVLALLRRTGLAR
jgi:multiple sugar transport system permease protein